MMLHLLYSSLARRSQLVRDGLLLSLWASTVAMERLRQNLNKTVMK